MSEAFEVGLYTFGDLTPAVQSSEAIGAPQRLAEILPQQSLPTCQVLMFLRLVNITGWIWPSRRRPLF